MSFQAEYIDLSKVGFTQELLECVPRHLAHKYRMLPVSVSPESLCIAMVDPTDLDAIDAVTHLLKRPVLCRSIDEQQFDTFYRRLYSHHEAEYGTSREGSI
jgi:type IV pilus assembly protein PilB